MIETMTLDSRIYIAGHGGLVGSAIVRHLIANGFDNLLLVSRSELDLRDQRAVSAWFEEHRPEFVFHAAGLVGGILENQRRPAEFLYDNTMIHATVMHAAYQTAVKKLLYLGSSCIYPRDATQPIQENQLLTGPLEPTNASYAISKICGLVACQAYREQYGCRFISAMPTNLYGPNDNFDLTSSHVLPALIRKFHDAKVNQHHTVNIWGSGQPRREFMHVDDLANACVHLMHNYDRPEVINVGTGQDLSIRELAELIGNIIYPECELVFDQSMPDGMLRKLLDVSKLHSTGWKHSIDLQEGIRQTYRWFVDNHE